MAVGDDILSFKEVVEAATDQMLPSTDAKTAGTGMPQTWYHTYNATETAYRYLIFRVVVAETYAEGNLTVEGRFICDLATSGTVRVEAAFSRIPVNVAVTGASTPSYQTTDITVNQAVDTPYAFSIAFTRAQADNIAKNDEAWLIIRRRRTAPDDALGGAKFSALSIVAREAA